MNFQHQPLNVGEIRLLKPLSGSSAPLSFKVVHVAVASGPSYAALSYTWGPPGNTDEILLDGQAFPIRKNLKDALDQIQSSKLVDHHIWIDAVCIDQDSGSEKTEQIQIMKQIYEQAEKVLVWLGKPDNKEDNRLAFQKMAFFDKSLRRVMVKGRPYRPWWWKRKLRTVGDDLADFSLAISTASNKSFFDVPGSQTYRAWLGITSLWKSPWFTRTWIFQEATIPEKFTAVYVSGITVLPPSSKVRFLCGVQQTTWRAINAAHLVAATLLNNPAIDSTFISTALVSSAKLVRFREYRLLHMQRASSFLEILQMFRHTECYDPRDKVYAPLCLAPDDVHQYVRPDYNKTVLDVYREVVQYYLAQSENKLDFIGNIMYREESQTVTTPKGVTSILPSWIPNLATSIQIVPIPKTLYVPERQKEMVVTSYDKRGVPAANPTLSPAFAPLDGYPCRASISNNTLHLNGVHIDVLADKISSQGPSLDAIRSAARDKSSQWARKMNGRYFTGETTGEAFNRTVVLDVRYDDLRRPCERGGKQDIALLNRPGGELTAPEYQFQRNMRVARTNALNMRDIGFSEKCYYLMVPNTAQLGDEIWALCGGKVLFMLRAVDREMRQFLLIGECYAHGLMDGDVVRRLQCREVKVEDIVLV